MERKKFGMRFAPMVVAVTVALASTVLAVPVAHAQIEVVDTPVEPPVEKAPPAVMINGELHVLVDGQYRKVDHDSSREPDRGLVYPKNKEQPKDKEQPEDKEQPNVAKWLVPLLVTGGVIAGLAGLIRKLYPSGRLILYYMPGKSISL